MDNPEGIDGGFEESSQSSRTDVDIFHVGEELRERMPLTEDEFVQKTREATESSEITSPFPLQRENGKLIEREREEVERFARVSFRLNALMTEGEDDLAAAKLATILKLA